MAAHGSGALFASLFFDQINSPGDQEGFLLGKIIDQVHDRISDSQISNYKVETRVCIYSYLPWPRVEKLYNHAGQFSIDLLKHLLAGKEKDVIGWYKFRRNSTLRPSLKESTLHCNLICSLSLEYDQPENFMFFLCTAFTSKNLSTHSYDHCFLKHHHGKFRRIPVQILNLGDTTHTTYRQQPNLVIDPESGTLHSVLHEFRNDFVGADDKMSEVKRIRGMANSVHKTLQTLSTVVLQSELKLGTLEAEVQMLAKRLEDKEDQCRPAKPVPQSSPPPPYMEIFMPVPMPSRNKIHSARLESKLRRSIGGSDGSVRHVRQISMDEDEYSPREDKSATLVNIRDYDIIEGPEKISQDKLSSSIADQSITYPPDVTTEITDINASDSTVGRRMGRRNSKTNSLEVNPEEETARNPTPGEAYSRNRNPGEAYSRNPNPVEAYSRNANPEEAGSRKVNPGKASGRNTYPAETSRDSRNPDHFSFVNNMLEKEKQPVKSVDSMAIPVGEQIKLPPSCNTKSECRSEEAGSKLRTRSSGKSTSKHKLYTPSTMPEELSGPELNTNHVAHVSTPRPQQQTSDAACKVEKSKSGNLGNVRTRTRQGRGQSERLKTKESYNGDYRNVPIEVGDESLRTRSSSPRNRQNFSSKSKATSSDACVERDCSKDANKHDGLGMSSSPVF